MTSEELSQELSNTLNYMKALVAFSTHPKRKFQLGGQEVAYVYDLSQVKTLFEATNQYLNRNKN